MRVPFVAVMLSLFASCVSYGQAPFHVRVDESEGDRIGNALSIDGEEFALVWQGYQTQLEGIDKAFGSVMQCVADHRKAIVIRGADPGDIRVDELPLDLRRIYISDRIFQMRSQAEQAEADAFFEILDGLADSADRVADIRQAFYRSSLLPLANVPAARVDIASILRNRLAHLAAQAEVSQVLAEHEDRSHELVLRLGDLQSTYWRDRRRAESAHHPDTFGEFHAARAVVDAELIQNNESLVQNLLRVLDRADAEALEREYSSHLFPTIWSDSADRALDWAGTRAGSEKQKAGIERLRGELDTQRLAWSRRLREALLPAYELEYVRSREMSRESISDDVEDSRGDALDRLRTRAERAMREKERELAAAIGGAS